MSNLTPSINYMQNEFASVLRENMKDLQIQMRTPEEMDQLFKNIPYNFDPGRPLRSFKEVRRDGYAACGEAAAAIGASLAWRDREFQLCLRVDGLTNSTHIVLISDGFVFDPYADYFNGGSNCAGSIQILPV